MEKQIINKRELSQYLGFSLGKIDNLIKENKIEYYKIGKNVRFHLNDEIMGDEFKTYCLKYLI